MPTSKSPSFEAEINDQYIQSELTRVDLLVVREVQRWQSAGQDQNDDFRGLTISDQDAEEIASQPLGGNWGQNGRLSEAEEMSFSAALQAAEENSQAIEALAQSENIALRLRRVSEAFSLDSFERDAFLICLLPAMDLRYERLFGYLQDDVTRKRPTVNLLLNLLATPEVSRFRWMARLQANSSLFENHLLQRTAETAQNSNWLSQALQVDPTIQAWLLGRYIPPVDFTDMVELLTQAPGVEDPLLAGSLEGRLDFQFLAGYPRGKALMLALCGADRTRQEAAARLVAHHLGRSILKVDLSKIGVNEQNRFAECISLALRDARLLDAVPFISGWEAVILQEKFSLGDDKGAQRYASQGIPPANLLNMLFDFPGIAITSSMVIWQVAGIERETAVFWLDFSVPGYPQRQELWQAYLQQAHIPAGEQRLDINAVSGQFALSSGQIRDAVASAMDQAMQEGRNIQSGDLFSAARLHSNSYLGGLARKIEPRYQWDDIILPADQMAILHEIISTVRSRPIVLDEWAIGKKLVSSAGIPMLFSGPPGTGKTMAAEVIANELGLDLFKIDLSGVVSKYIGETEKNLERIFDEAEHSNAILFFDEADSIFGKRSEVKDAHDRYANIEISYLLQRMERYGGVTILATNLRANLDEAFTRRLQFVIDFPFPDEEHRLKIWKALFPTSVPHAPDLDFQFLAHNLKLAGGNIRNIIVGAAYLAAADGRVILMEHLLHSARRELQKMGRLVNERDLRM